MFAVILSIKQLKSRETPHLAQADCTMDVSVFCSNDFTPLTLQAIQSLLNKSATTTLYWGCCDSEDMQCSVDPNQSI